MIKNTVTVVDGSENTAEIMLQNAANVGLSADEVEILTEEEYKVRFDSMPKPPQPPTQEKRLEALELAMLDMVLGGV